MASRSTRRIIGLIGFFFVAFIIGCLTTPAELYSSYISSFISRSLTKVGIVSKFEDLKVKGAGLHAARIGFFIPKAFTSLDLVDTDCSIAVRDIFQLVLTVDCAGRAYGGNFSVRFSSTVDKSNQVINLDIRNLSLPQHPQVLGFGITKGQLSISAQNVKIDHGIASGTITIQGNDIDKKEDSFISSPDRSQFAVIPKFADLRFVSRVNTDQGKLLFSLRDCTSSLGAVTGDIDMLYPSKPPTLAGKLNIELAPEAQKNFGPLLAMSNKGQIKDDMSKFKVLLDGNWPKIHARLE